MRADVWQRARDAATEMLAIEQTYLAPVAKALVDDQAGAWSEPVQVRYEPHEDGTIDIVFRQVER